MNWRNTAETYGLAARLLHGVVALVVIGLIGVGLYMSRLDPSPAAFKIYALHKAVGITVLALVALRLVWRFSNIHPLALPTHKKWEKLLASLIHWFFYTALILMPLSGWIMSSAKGFSVSVFGLFTLPDLVKPSEDLARFAADFHEILAYILIGAIGLHLAGALKHHIIDRDDTLRRMILPRRRKDTAP